MLKNSAKKSVRILGIDPGYGRMGFGVVDYCSGTFKYVAHGCVETKIKSKFIDRLQEIHVELNTIIKKYSPNCAGVEELFFAKNAKTAIQVGQARGVILLTLVQAGLKVSEFTPLEVKQSLTGYGRAEKAQVQKMVGMLLGIKKGIQDDAADALAIAVTCGSGLGLATKISALTSQS